MLKYLFCLAILVSSTYIGQAQTCCSGGVPLAGNIGFIETHYKKLQVELSYDYNYLNSLFHENERLDDQSRTRVTQSVLFKYGFAFTQKISAEGLFTYVKQERFIRQFDQTDYSSTSGIGDAVVIVKYTETFGYDRLNLGLGPKIPIGKSNLTNESGIAYNADLQPGSGSWDVLLWVNYIRQSRWRPSIIFYASITLRGNGVNRNYFETESYHFGNSVNTLAGLSDRFIVNTFAIDPSISFSFRKALPDKINNKDLDNTGGTWLSIAPGLSIAPMPNLSVNLAATIPVYQYISGTQLSPTVRLRAGIYYLFSRKDQLQINNSL